MQFEFIIKPIDMQVLLNDCILQRKKIVLKLLAMKEIENCIVVDFNERTKIVGVIYNDSNDLMLKNIPLYTIESIEFDSFYTYKRVSAKSFIVE